MTKQPLSILTVILRDGLKKQLSRLRRNGSTLWLRVLCATTTKLQRQWKARKAGYQIDARALAVTARFSKQGIMQRYKNQKADRGFGRMTTVEAHKAAYDGMLQTLDRIERQKLADRVMIYRRGVEVIYANELRDGQWTHEPQARTVVEVEWARPMTLQECQDYFAGFDELIDMLAKPERRASVEEIRKVGHLRHQTEVLLAAKMLSQDSPEVPTVNASTLLKKPTLRPRRN